MPGRLFIKCDQSEIERQFGVEAASDVQGPDLPDLDISPGGDIWTLDDTGKLASMRWGMIMTGQSKGRRQPLMETVINARSETVFEKQTFEGVRRALVPAHGWYEWTGEKRRKTQWRICSINDEILMFAAIYSVWTGPGGVSLRQCATLTCEPNAQIAPIHHRMGVILEPERWSAWLASKPVELKPWPNGKLSVEKMSGDRG